MFFNSLSIIPNNIVLYCNIVFWTLSTNKAHIWLDKSSEAAAPALLLYCTSIQGSVQSDFTVGQFGTK